MTTLIPNRFSGPANTALITPTEPLRYWMMPEDWVLKFMTPHQRHSGQANEVMDNSKEIYKAAKAANLKRWSKDIRDWNLPDKVWLNPEKDRGELEVAA